jgi:hypothetical protein
MHGARSHATTYFFLAVVAGLYSTAPVSAVELGNMLFKPAEVPSRAASALALSAISDAMRAFEKRELYDEKASQELMAQSREKLRDAADKMSEILRDGSQNSEFRQYLDSKVDLQQKLLNEDVAFYTTWAGSPGQFKSRGEVFQIFIVQTYKLAVALELPQTDPDFFRRTIDQITNYLKGGDITTRLLRET